MINLASVEAMLDQRLKVLGETLKSFGLGNHHGGSNSNFCADSGKTLSHKVTNSYMTFRLGVFAQHTFEITGDITNSNVSKLTKIMMASKRTALVPATAVPEKAGTPRTSRVLLILLAFQGHT